MDQARLAQSDAGPFPKPRCNHGGEPCGECHLQPGEACDICGATDKRSPDASGLIEAAEWRIILQALRIAREDGSIDNFVTDAEYEALREKVRSRAADRSGK
jgi:hypothetical protein